MKKSVLFAISILFFLASCSRDEADILDNNPKKKIASFKDYFEFINTKTNGSVIIQSIETIHSNGSNYHVTTSIDGNRMPFSLTIDGTKISFDEYHYSETNKKSYSYKIVTNLSVVFGNNFKVELEPSDVLMKTGLTDSSTTYIPDLIHAEFIGLQEGKIVAGTTVSWNFDGENENGVVVGIEYTPLTQTEEAIAILKPESSLIGHTLPDNGSYTFTAQDLMEYPNNAILRIYVGRAGYSLTIINNGDQLFSVAGLTVSSADFRIQK